MIRDLDETIRTLLQTAAPVGSLLAQAGISFDVPDEAWRNGLTELSVNCYLYDVRENLELRTTEPRIQRNEDRTRAVRRLPLVRIDCSYMLTAWSVDTEDAVLEQHELLTEILMVLLRNRTLPPSVLQGTLVDQVPPYPTVVAVPSTADDQMDFWSTIGAPIVPSLNYVVTLALVVDDEPDTLPLSVETVELEVDHKS